MPTTSYSQHSPAMQPGVSELNVTDIGLSDDTQTCPYVYTYGYTSC